MNTDTSMIFNVLIKKDANFYIAHCLELDIVATSEDLEKAKTDMLDLIKAQVDYAFSNDNLDYLYHPAPTDVWQEFYACKEQIEKRIHIKSAFTKASQRFVPPWIIARTCMSFGQSYHA
ncbi:MAG: hypothetical protein V2A69_11440 [Pseudomonadota bacterium]